ncbi:MAG: hypothetical protein NW223_04010 [Hyphomicrobiaceae bacterium]|nr:hypothetical protein [Hyphomicrobiaceae bacterium]
MTATRASRKPTWKERTIERIRSRIDAHRILDLKQSPFAVL